MWRFWVGLVVVLLTSSTGKAEECSDFLIERAPSPGPLLDSRKFFDGALPDLAKLQPIQYVAALDVVERRLISTLADLVANADTSFAAIIVPLEKRLSEIDRVLGFWQWQTSSNRTAAVLSIEKIIEKRRVRIWERIFANSKLFAKIVPVYNQRESLDPDQIRLVEYYYNLFADYGLSLSSEGQARLLQIRKDLSQLRIQFNTNLVQSRGAFKMFVREADELKGLSSATLELMHESARAEGQDGYLLTLSPAVYTEVMAYCQNPQIRKSAFMGMQTVAAEGTRFANTSVIQRLIELRTEQARLLGYGTYADWILSRRMVGSLANLKKFYAEEIDAVRTQALEEEKELKAFVDEHFGVQEIKSWDRPYYQRLFVERTLQMDAHKIKEHFTLKRSIDVLFKLIHRLYNIRLIERTDLPTPHPDTSVFEVQNDRGQTISYVYFSPYSRSGLKVSGAWMTNISTQSPSLVTINMNLQKPTLGAPTLMSPDDMVTLFHEFGHGLHAILSRARYHSQFGTRVVRDAVELPSQFLERFVFLPSVLGELAYDAETGVHLGPDDMAKLIRSRDFREATHSMRQIRLGMLDVAWHSGLTPSPNETIRDYENRVLKDVALYDDPHAALISLSFSHIFSGGYASGYYVYKWSDRLVDKVMTKFEREGMFNPQTAAAFEKYFLAVGDGMDPGFAIDLFLSDSSEPKSN